MEIWKEEEYFRDKVSLLAREGQFWETGKNRAVQLEDNKQEEE